MSSLLFVALVNLRLNLHLRYKKKKPKKLHFIRVHFVHPETKQLCNNSVCCFSPHKNINMSYYLTVHNFICIIYVKTYISDICSLLACATYQNSVIHGLCNRCDATSIDASAAASVPTYTRKCNKSREKPQENPIARRQSVLAVLTFLRLDNKSARSFPRAFSLYV